MKYLKNIVNFVKLQIALHRLEKMTDKVRFNDFGKVDKTLARAIKKAPTIRMD